MVAVKDAAEEFLALRRIAVTGVSRDPRSSAANGIYKRFRERGFEVFAVNPNADEVEGDRCYHDLSEIPGGVEAVVVATHPDVTDKTVRECVDLGIKHVWMHRAFGRGSVCAEATVHARENGVTVIDGGCPLMFGPTADGFHKLMRSWFTASGKVPRTV